MRQWRGASDARVAEHIRGFAAQPTTLQPRPSADWAGLLEELLNTHAVGQIKLKTSGVDSLLKPLLYYFNVLVEQRGPEDLGVTVDVDHIIPQAAFAGSTIVQRDIYMHNLFNLALLPRRENVAKRDLFLSDVRDAWLRDQIEIYLRIPRADFARYSAVASIVELKATRRGQFLDAFGPRRDAIFVG